jgi:hypothetical protein
MLIVISHMPVPTHMFLASAALFGMSIFRSTFLIWFCTTFKSDRTHFRHHSAFLSFVAFALIIVFRTRFTCERDSGQTTCGLLHACSLFLSSFLTFCFCTQFTCERSRSDHVRTVAHLQLAHYHIFPWWVIISYKVHVRTGLIF